MFSGARTAAMHESLWRWVWLLWVCLAAVATAVPDKGQCEVLDLSLKPPLYQLPTNLTLRPMMSGWQLNFTLLDDQATPAACVWLKEKRSMVKVMLYDKDCLPNKPIGYNFLHHFQVPPHQWTNLALHVEDKTVVIKPPNSRVIFLKANISLAHHALQVTLAQDVQVAVGCRVSCPLYIHDSKGVKKKVYKWRHSKLNFFFMPGSSFNSLRYQVKCKTEKKHFTQNVNLTPLPGWNRVKLEQRNISLKVFINNRLLEEIFLPDCIDIMHVTWMVGNATFTYNCEPEEVHLDGVDTTTTPTAPDLSKREAIGVGMILMLIIVGILNVIYHYHQCLLRAFLDNCTCVNQRDLVSNDLLMLPGTQPKDARQYPGEPRIEEAQLSCTQTATSDASHTPASHSQVTTDTEVHHDSLSQTEEASQTFEVYRCAINQHTHHWSPNRHHAVTVREGVTHK